MDYLTSTDRYVLGISLLVVMSVCMAMAVAIDKLKHRVDKLEQTKERDRQ